MSTPITPDRVMDYGLAISLARIFKIVAAIALFFLMALTCVDVIGRYVFNNPLTGSTELTEFAVAIVVFAYLPVISWREEHIVVDLMDNLFSTRMQRIRSNIINIIIAVSLIFLGLRIEVLASRSLRYGQVSEYMEFPVGYIRWFIAIMCWVTAIGLMLNLLHRGYLRLFTQTSDSP